jgi:hypothetical protein
MREIKTRVFADVTSSPPSRTSLADEAARNVAEATMNREV